MANMQPSTEILGVIGGTLSISLVVLAFTYEISLLAEDSVPLLVRFVSTFFERVAVVLRDFRAARYYKPWESKKPIVIVTSKKHILELSDSPALSQRAVYADMFGFKHTIKDFNHNERTLTKPRLFGRMLQVNGPRHLPGLFDAMKARMETTFDSLILPGNSLDDKVSVPCVDMTKRVASRMMSVLFFGPELSSDKTFTDALLQYPNDMVNSMMAFQITPKYFSSYVHKLVTKDGRAMRTFREKIRAVIDTGNEAWPKTDYVRKNTLLWNMVDLSKDSEYWTTELLSQSLLGIWFAAAHQPWMNLCFIILELCARPEWQSLLRDEIGDYELLTHERLEALPLLDSFIKETVRLSPLDNLAIRRKAMEPFTFSNDGPHVPAGSIAAVSSYNLMHDPHSYPNPAAFNPQRFLDETNEIDRRFVGVSEKFPIWGFGSLACPGRLHASMVIKMSLAYLISNFDMEIQDKSKRTKWMWETFTMPYQSTRLVLQRRDIT